MVTDAFDALTELRRDASYRLHDEHTIARFGWTSDHDSADGMDSEGERTRTEAQQDARAEADCPRPCGWNATQRTFRVTFGMKAQDMRRS
jgi:hypothetical protein